MTLHPPVSITDEYLAAVYERLGETNELLGGILNRLSEPQPAEEPSPVVELREPAAATPQPDSPAEDAASAAELSEPAPAPRPTRKRAPARKTKET